MNGPSVFLLAVRSDVRGTNACIGDRQGRNLAVDIQASGTIWKDWWEASLRPENPPIQDVNVNILLIG